MTWHLDLLSFFVGFSIAGTWVVGVLAFLRVFFPRRSFKQVAGDNSTQIQIGKDDET